MSPTTPGPRARAACCGERPLPGAKYPPGFNGPGGGRIGAVVLSPFVRPGTVSDVPYNHYALLRTIEALFGLPYLGYAAQADLQAFGADVFTAQATPRRAAGALIRRCRLDSKPAFAPSCAAASLLGDARAAAWQGCQLALEN